MRVPLAFTPVLAAFFLASSEARGDGAIGISHNIVHKIDTKDATLNSDPNEAFPA
jgi:hypothetical protein